MAAKQWTKRPRPGREPEVPGWMATIGSATAPRAALLGMALSGANAKNLALTLYRRRVDRRGGPRHRGHGDRRRRVTALGSVTVAGSVLFYLLAGDRAARPLAAVKQFMADNDAVIMMVVLLLLGAKLLGDGLAGLWQMIRRYQAPPPPPPPPPIAISNLSSVGSSARLRDDRRHRQAQAFDAAERGRVAATSTRAWGASRP